MSRAQRLLDLLQLLRTYRFPVTGEVLAQQLGVSRRTLYRDIQTLQAQGAQIEGEAGLGYVLKPGFILPPLMFSGEEIQALVLGCRWVIDRCDDELGHAAAQALSKIRAVLPTELRLSLEHSPLLIGPGEVETGSEEFLPQLRQAIHREHKLQLDYRDQHNRVSARTVWPCAIGYFDHVRVLVAWCELRQQFRHFRTDRIVSLQALTERYPQRRQTLLQHWREQESIPADRN